MPSSHFSCAPGTYAIVQSCVIVYPRAMVKMTDGRYRLEETLRLIGKGLDHRLSPPERSVRMLELLEVLSEIDVPARRDNDTTPGRPPARCQGR